MTLNKLVGIGMFIKQATYFMVMIVYLSGDNQEIGSVVKFGMN